MESQLSSYCRKCGGNISLNIPKNDNRERHVCTKCGYIDYINPKMVVGCIVENEDKVLLCKRAIEPCKGLWTLPAGFLEIGESTSEGARRETLEEANASVTILAPYSHLDVPIIGQTYIIFRAALDPPFKYSPGSESLETEFFELDEIPFDKIAFSTISVTLQKYVEDVKSGNFHVHHGVIQKKPGSLPNDPSTFSLVNYMAIPIKNSIKKL